MVVGFLSLPTELTCHILLFLPPKDLSRCTITCKTIHDAARNSVPVQYKLELYAQGLDETVTLNSTDVAKKMHFLEKLASLWRSDFDAKTVFGLRADSDHWHGQWKCGFWWTWRGYDGSDNLFIWDCNAGLELAHPCKVPKHTPRSDDYALVKVVVDPLQDLMVLLFSSYESTEANTYTWPQHYKFLVEFRSLSSQLPHPRAACTSLVDEHLFESRCYIEDSPQPKICGDRVVFPFKYKRNDQTSWKGIFILVMNWRKGYINSYPLDELDGHMSPFHLVDEQTIVFVVTYGDKSFLTLYTLRELDGLPQHRITYLLPDLDRDVYASINIHATPSFHGTAVRADLLPGHVPALESQIMVLEITSPLTSGLVVIDMVIFSEQAIHSETPVKIPWSDWGPKYTWCFQHDPRNEVSVFGSKMAYTLPLWYTPWPGEKIRSPDDDDEDFYVHIWDFNQRVTARAQNPNSRDDISGCRSEGLYQPGLPFEEEIFNHRGFNAAVCRTPFPAYEMDRIFFDQDRLILTSCVSQVIRIICPVDGEDVCGME